MNIREIYIDGYKNIKNTRLNFSKSMVVLLSRNNYGKTNVLNGIKDSFDFLRSNSKEATDYIDGGTYKDKFSKEHSMFTFEIRFKCDSCETTLFRYKYSIGKIVDTGNIGVCEEELARQDNDDTPERILLKRCKENPEDAHLYGRDGKELGLYSAFDSRSLLYLRAFREALLDKKDGSKWDASGETLEDIRKAFNCLTEKSVGEFLVYEDTNLKDFSNVAVKLENQDKKMKEKFEKFTVYFLELFTQYKGVKIQKLAGTPHLVFIRKANGTEEDISTLSFGTRRVLRLLFEALVSESPLIFIEELENGIHPKLFVEVANKIFEIVSAPESKSCLVVTSHSMSLVSLLKYILDIVHFGPTVHLPDDADDSDYEKARFASFYAISEKGKNEIDEEMKRIRSTAGVGEFIFDYDDIPEMACKIRQWLVNT